MTERFYNALRRGGAARGKDFVTLITASINQALASPPETWTKGSAIPNLSDLDPAAKPIPPATATTSSPTNPSATTPRTKTKKSSSSTSMKTATTPPSPTSPNPSTACAPPSRRPPPPSPNSTSASPAAPPLKPTKCAPATTTPASPKSCGLSLVFVALWIFLRKLWLVIVAELCLGVGIGWTFGWATLSTGRLNLLSLVFVIALIGIGMDYLIQILTRYRHEKQRYTRPDAIWSRVFRYVSPPISTACLGAAGAFFVSKLTRFAGAGELGVIAGGGLLLCLLAGYTLMPALLTLFPANVGKIREENRYTGNGKSQRVAFWRLAIPVAWILIAAGGLWVALPPKFDPDLIKLQAQGLDSVKLVHKLPTWYGAVMTDDLAKLRAGAIRAHAAAWRSHNDPQHRQPARRDGQAGMAREKQRSARRD